MGGAVDGKIAIAVALVVTDFLSDARGKDLGATAGQRIKSGLAQLDEDRSSVIRYEVGEIRDLDGREALEVYVWSNALQSAQQILVVVERQLGMKPFTIWISVSGS